MRGWKNMFRRFFIYLAILRKSVQMDLIQLLLQAIKGCSFVILCQRLASTPTHNLVDIIYKWTIEITNAKSFAELLT